MLLDLLGKLCSRLLLLAPLTDDLQLLLFALDTKIRLLIVLLTNWSRSLRTTLPAGGELASATTPRCAAIVLLDFIDEVCFRLLLAAPLA